MSSDVQSGQSGSVVAVGDPEADEVIEDEAFSRLVGQRLRSVRRAQGLSLADVEQRSGGKWSSSAIGAYERGFRNLSVPRLHALADFYRVPMASLLGEPSYPVTPSERHKLVLDLEALRRSAPNEPVMRFVNSVIVSRGDFNGRVLSLRRDDLRAICALIGVDEEDGLRRLREWNALIEGPGMEAPDVEAEPGDDAHPDSEPVGSEVVGGTRADHGARRHRHFGSDVIG